MMRVHRHSTSVEIVTPIAKFYGKYVVEMTILNKTKKQSKWTQIPCLNSSWFVKPLKPWSWGFFSTSSYTRLSLDSTKQPGLVVGKRHSMTLEGTLT